ncbi:MAG: winged helix-turn-helix transcriptional regulator [Coriobacteriia bacterium]
MGTVSKDNAFLKETEALRDLRTLEAIERNPNLSQRELAQSMGVALGIVNACIHTLVRKGLVKVRGENNRSISYHLTKKGVLAKSGLAVEWTRNTIGFYREARSRVSGNLARMSADGVRRLALWGATELAEIVVIASRDAGVEIVAIVDEGDSYLKDTLAGIEVGGPEAVGRNGADAIAISADVPEAEFAEIEARIASAFPGMRTYRFAGQAV